MTTWFGKDCAWITAQHEHDDEDKKCTPILVFCNHLGNTDTCEGNCCEAKCPLKLKMDAFTRVASGDMTLADVLAGVPVPAVQNAEPPAYAVDLCLRTYNYMVFGKRFDDVRCSEIKSRLAAVFGQDVVDAMLVQIGVTA